MNKVAEKNRDRVAAALAGHDGFTLIPDARLLEIAQAMHALHEQSTFDLAGCEAVLISATVGLNADDLIAPAAWAQPACTALARKLAPHAQTSALQQILATTRAAIGLRTEEKGRAAVVFAGDDLASFADCAEALHLAGNLRLPVLFYFLHGLHDACPTGRQIEIMLEKSRAMQIPAMAVDGHDAVAVYRVATESLAHARRGNGPTVIFCEPFPLDHSADARNPLARIDAYLRRKSL